MPSTAEILNFFQNYYDIFGYPLIFGGALLENILPLGFFVPGSTLVWLGAFYSYQGKLSIAGVIAFGTIGSFLGHNVDYFMGRTGWYRLFKRFVSEDKLARAENYISNQRYLESLIIYFIGYTRSVFIIGMGVVKLDYLRFASFAFVSALLWNLVFSFFGFTVGSKREIFEKGLNILWLTGFFVLISYFLAKLIREKRKSRKLGF